MNSINHHDYIIKKFEKNDVKKAFASEFKKIMHINNALFTDMLMLCDRRNVTSQRL